MALVILASLPIAACGTKKGEEIMKINSNNMSPELNDGDEIEVIECDISTIKIGDIITFSIPDSNDPQTSIGLMSSRVIEINTGNEVIVLTTKGDANNFADPWPVTKDNFYGLVGKVNSKK